MANAKHLYLMIKTHQITGLKYLCKRVTTSDVKAISYKGSGKYWKNHLKVHGKNINTEILEKYELNKIEEFSKLCLEYSAKFNIVMGDEWANLMEENGLDGAVIGENNPSKKMEVALKISKSLTGKYRGEKASFYGKKHTLETRQKMSAANKGDNNVMRRRPDSLAKMIATKNTSKYKNEAALRAIEINSRPEVKEKIRHSKLGNNNPAADKNIYKLKNIISGDILEGTRIQIKDEMNKLKNNNLKKLSLDDIGYFFRKTKNITTVKGWIKL
jgi:hypothetical protein